MVEIAMNFFDKVLVVLKAFYDYCNILISYVFYPQRNIRNNKIINANLVPISVNYHFTRKCNYECGFCFHTSKTSFMLSLEDAKVGMEMLKNAGKVQSHYYF